MGISTGVLFGIITMLCWGSSDVAAKILIDRIGYFRALLWSQILGIAPLIILALFFLKQQITNFSITDIFLFALSGMLAAAGYVLFYAALKKGTVSVQCPVQASSVIIAVILSMIFLKEVLEIKQIVFINIVIIGILLVSFKINDLKGLKLKNILPGTSYNLASICCWGIYFVIIGHLISKFSWIMPIVIMKIGIVIALIAYSPFTKQAAKQKFFAPIFTSGTIKLIIILAALDVAGFLAYSFGVNSEQVSIVTPVAEAFPLVSVILAKIFLKETLSANQLIGVAAIVAGIVGLAV